MLLFGLWPENGKHLSELQWHDERRLWRQQSNSGAECRSHACSFSQHFTVYFTDIYYQIRRALLQYEMTECIAVAIEKKDGIINDLNEIIPQKFVPSVF